MRKRPGSALVVVRIGIYGGSFDPPHIGHRILAVEAAERLPLDRLFIVPTGIQPLKSGKKDGASPQDRLAMAKLAFAGLKTVAVDEDEINRPGLSFTVETMSDYARRFAGAELFLLLGRDSFNAFGKWKQPEKIREMCTIALLGREGSGDTVGEGVVSVTTRRIDISSSEIRERRRAGKSIAGFVPDAVLKYIEARNLYAPDGASRE